MHGGRCATENQMTGYRSVPAHLAGASSGLWRCEGAGAWSGRAAWQVG